MGDTVFANGRAIACQASSGKTTAAFPDVCLSPPPPPTGPLPVPYPNTAKASDLQKGSNKVTIEGGAVYLEDQSVFSTSSGDEGGTQGGGVITHKTKGTAQFVSWSFDVMFEGKGVPRHLDMTINNGSSIPDNTAPWPYLSKADQAGAGTPCDGVDAKFKLTAYSQGCNGGKTPHHIIPDRTMRQLVDRKIAAKSFAKYAHSSAPCYCVTGTNQYQGDHGLMHAIIDPVEHTAAQAISAGTKSSFTYADAKSAAIDSATVINNNQELSDKEKECVSAQIDYYYKNRCKANDSDPLFCSDTTVGRNLTEGNN